MLTQPFSKRSFLPVLVSDADRETAKRMQRHQQHLQQKVTKLADSDDLLRRRPSPVIPLLTASDTSLVSRAFAFYSQRSTTLSNAVLEERENRIRAANLSRLEQLRAKREVTLDGLTRRFRSAPQLREQRIEDTRLRVQETVGDRWTAWQVRHQALEAKRRLAGYRKLRELAKKPKAH